MVPDLWKACAEGDLENVHRLLKDASTLDIEIRGKLPRNILHLPFDHFNLTILYTTDLIITLLLPDHTGVTPLIEAVKNGHVEVVRALLDKGHITCLTSVRFSPCNL